MRYVSFVIFIFKAQIQKNCHLNTYLHYTANMCSVIYYMEKRSIFHSSEYCFVSEISKKHFGTKVYGNQPEMKRKEEIVIDQRQNV